MIIPVRTDARLRSTPYMNWALIVANVLIFCFVQHSYFLGGHWSLNAQGINPAITNRFELWPDGPSLKTFISYAFMHANLMHLLGNMVFLYIFGNNVNDKMGNLGYLAFYLAGGVAAGIGYVLMSGNAGPVIGASGAIAAVTGAYLVLFLQSHITIFYVFWLIGQFEIRSLYFILFFFVKDLFLNFAGEDMVAHVAHIGGTVFGFLVCLGMLWIGLLPRDQFDLIAGIKQWNRRRQYRDMVSKGYNPFEYSANQRAAGGKAVPVQIDPAQEKIMTLRASILDLIARHELDKVSPIYLELIKLDPRQVLPKQPQLDVANQLAGEQRFADAVPAYEAYLQAYPKAERRDQIELMVGVIYARYLAQPEPARRHLEAALQQLHDPASIDLASDELAKLGETSKPTS